MVKNKSKIFPKSILWMILIIIGGIITCIIIWAVTRNKSDKPPTPGPPTPGPPTPGPPTPGPPTPGPPTSLINCYDSILSLMASYNKSGCINDQSGASCFKECSIGQECPSGSGCDPGCGFCGCDACPACSASTHIGSWHLANIFRLFINFYKLLIKTGKSISNYNTGLTTIGMFAQQTEFFTLTSKKTWTNRNDWITNKYFNGLFFDDIGWWILANIDLYELLLDDSSQLVTISKETVLQTAIKLTNIISNANSSLCDDSDKNDKYKSIEWNCPNWKFNSAQKNIITNCLVIISQARLIPFISDNNTKQEYLESIEKIWNFLTTYSITNPTVQYGTYSEQYQGTVCLIDIKSDGTIIVNDHLGNLDKNSNYSKCTPCEERMNNIQGCTNIPCTFMNCNQWTYNYGAVIGTLLALDKIKDQLNFSNMGKHTNFLTLAKQTATSLLNPKNVAVTTYNLNIDPSAASFVSKGILKDNCKLWAGTICNPDQWIFRGLTIWWLGKLIKANPNFSTFKSIISTNSQALVQNSTKFKNITIYPFKWDDPKFDWCELTNCIPKCSEINCDDFYKKNGYNRFEISNQIGAGYVLNTEFLLNL